MKKQLALLLTLIMMVSLVAAGCAKDDTSTEGAGGADGSQDTSTSEGIYNPGTYEGDGTGHAGPIKVSVTVTDTEITEIEFLDFNESEFALDPANQLLDSVKEANSGDVDVVAGASLTSAGVLEAVQAALAKAYVDGAVPTDADQDVDAEVAVLEDVTTDVVVIGAGGAGLTAAIEAKNSGAEVLVLEKMPLIGGNTKYATGGLNAAETSVQAKLGIEDSIDVFYEDTMNGGGNINNPELVRVLAENAKDTVDWLIEIGADLSDVGRLGGATNNRAHRPTGGAPVGNHITDVLYERSQELGIEVLLNSEVTALVGDDTGVTGVQVTSPEGTYTVHAKAVIMATGGFGANNALVASFRPEYEGYGTTNHPGATGDVVNYTEGFDVAFVDMDQIQTHPTVMPSNNYMITEAVRGNGAILVNRDAQRFINEIDTRLVVSNAELEQEGQTAFLIFDQGVRESLSAIDGYYNKGFLLEAETLEDLAAQLDIDGETLATTVATYNTYVEAGVDTDYNRPNMPLSLGQAPFYAVEVGPAVHHTMGGVEINTACEVLSIDGEIIAGLYAAGEVTGGVHGNNRLGGNALADITTFGRIAGANAAGYDAQ